jgi:hypothetical protein
MLLPRQSPRPIERLREATELPLGTPTGDLIRDEDLERILAKTHGDVDLAATAISQRSPWIRQVLGD